MRRWISLLLLVLLAASSAFSVYLLTENRRLRRELAARDAAPTSQAPLAPDVVADVPSGTAPAPAESTATLPPGVEGEAPNAGRPGRARDFGARRERVVEAMARVLNDPQARDALVGRMKSQIQRSYAGLFSRLGLDEVQAETLSTLLAERELVRRESGFLERTAASEEERVAARTARDSRLQSIESGVASILGPDGLQILQEYQASTPQRLAAEDVSRRAGFSGAALNPQQTDQLAQLLRAVQQEVPAKNPGLQPGWFREEGNPPQALTQSAVDEYLLAKEAQNQEVLKRAQTLLSVQQLEALADQQIEEMAQTRAQLDFQLRNPDIPAGMGLGFSPPGGPGGGGPGGPGGPGGRRPGGG